VKYGWRDKSDREKECPFREAVSFAGKFVGEKDVSKLAVDYEAFEKRRFASQMERIYSRQEPEVVHKIPKELVTSSLQIPAEYFVSRGFTTEILKKYDVGLCTTPNREMYMRATAPIYDPTHDYVIGCTGRSIFDSCAICESYHNPIKACPPEKDRWKHCKWRHNYGFKGEFHLYNYWFAKEFIRQTGIAIIVEGPADVWRLEEAGIHNAVATFGAHLTE
jgi:DNA primase